MICAFCGAGTGGAAAFIRPACSYFEESRVMILWCGCEIPEGYQPAFHIRLDRESARRAAEHAELAPYGLP